MEDLKAGMKLKGTVRNVIDFGAFVDIGVHQDGLVHISQMADRFVKHPSGSGQCGRCGGRDRAECGSGEKENTAFYEKVLIYQPPEKVMISPVRYRGAVQV